MQTTISNRALVIGFALTAVAGLYFASAGAAEARVGSTGLNRNASSTASSTTASSTRPRAVDATCMSAAVDTRETALMSAWSELNTSLTADLTARKTSLVAAWGMSDTAERSKALKTAWATWKTNKKEAHTEFKSDRKAAWETFKATVKSSCKTTLPKEEAEEKAAKDSIAI
jgi:hypothetical protein